MVRRARVSLVGLVVMSLLLTGCATLFKGQRQMVGAGSSPVGAEVFVNGVSMGFTPVQLNLDVARAHQVTFRLAGHRDLTVTLEPRVGIGWVILNVLGGLIPVVIDAATGSWNYLVPDNIQVTLQPTS